MTSTSGEAVSPGLWYLAGQTPQIGAFLPDYSADLTVYWRGKVDRHALLNILSETEQSLESAGEPTFGIVDTYGIKGPKTEEHLGPLPKLSEHINSLLQFETCRVELTTASERKIVVWANVSGKETAPLKEGGQNIGLSIPQVFALHGPLRPVIVHAISKTMSIDESSSDSLLSKVSKAIEKRLLVPGVA